MLTATEARKNRLENIFDRIKQSSSYGFSKIIVRNDLSNEELKELTDKGFDIHISYGWWPEWLVDYRDNRTFTIRW